MNWTVRRLKFKMCKLPHNLFSDIEIDLFYHCHILHDLSLSLILFSLYVIFIHSFEFGVIYICDPGAWVMLG